MKNLAILGSTGSIGRSALAVVDAHPSRLRLVGLAAGDNAQLLADQCRQYRPVIAAMTELIDSSVGRLLYFLEATNLDQETLVVFTSDHGAFGRSSTRKPLRGCNHLARRSLNGLYACPVRRPTRETRAETS